LLFAWERRPAPLATDPGDDALWRGQDEPDPGYGVRPESYGFEILEGLARHLPVLADEVVLRRVTCGWYAVTPDHKAILGEDPRCAGLYHAAGFSGHGIMHAPATGEVVAARVLDRPSAILAGDALETRFGLGPLLDGRERGPAESMVL
jgi:glycine/D-amino acid oxidase-like deaminating enzyme